MMGTLRKPITQGLSRLSAAADAARGAVVSWSSIAEVLSGLRTTLMQRHEDEREVNDALAARLSALEAEPHPDTLMADWEAVERSFVSRHVKLRAHRALYLRLALLHARCDASPASSSDSATRRRATMKLRIEVSPGELIDRLTILEIKLARLTSAAQLANVRRDIELTSLPLQSVPDSGELAALRAQLKAVNERIWDIEDAVRGHERDQSFGDAFVALARSVYRSNDERASLKRQINEFLRSDLMEEKSYAAY